MVIRAASPCRASGCPALVKDGSGYCSKHARPKEIVKRESAAKRGYGHAWRKAREGYLRSHPLCVACKERGIVSAAEHVDHIEPHNGDQQKFWDKGNWQGLCTPCHSRKTASEDGGFGNRKASSR